MRWGEQLVQLARPLQSPLSDCGRCQTVSYFPARCCDDGHFIAPLGTPTGTWWHYHDGMPNGGQPVVNSSTVHEELDLLTCLNGYILNALVYCLSC